MWSTHPQCWSSRIPNAVLLRANALYARYTLSARSLSHYQQNLFIVVLCWPLSVKHFAGCLGKTIDGPVMEGIEEAVGPWVHASVVL